MSVYSETHGVGPDIVLLHGWGLNSSIWDHFAEELGQHMRVTMIDLPGHGRSTMPDRYDLASLTQEILAAAPQRAIWLGWSFSGLIATHLATTLPERIAKLILVASSPRFVRDNDWPHAMTQQVLNQFSQDLENNYSVTLDRFLALLGWGGQDARAIVRKLRARLNQQSPPQSAALRGALSILHNTDMRPQLAQIKCPLLVVLGRHDALVPHAVAQDIIQLAPQARVEIFNAAGHAPFLTHTAEFMQLLIEFTNE